MDMETRTDVAAAAAAHRELGADYGEALAEGLVERIGAELDKRVDTRLAQHGRAARVPVAIGLGSMIVGAVVTLPVLIMTGSPEDRSMVGPAALVGLIWVIVAIVNVAYARRR
jgi:hypothetical protein